MKESVPGGAEESGPWHLVEIVLGGYGLYVALAAVVVIIAAWKSPQLLEQLRRWSEWIVLYRQTRSTTADDTAEKNAKLAQRIRAVRAIEEAPSETADKENFPES